MNRFRGLKKSTIIIVIVAMLASAGIGVLAAKVLNLGNSGVVLQGSIEAFEQDLTTPMTGINWGNIDAGSQSAQKPVYIKNTGNKAVTVTVALQGAPEGVTLDDDPNFSVVTLSLEPGTGASLNLILNTTEECEAITFDPETFLTVITATTN